MKSLFDINLSTIKISTIKTNLDWSNINMVKQYSKNINEKITNLNRLIIEELDNSETIRTKIENQMNELNSILVNTEKLVLLQSRAKELSTTVKRKDWWNKELSELKFQMDKNYKLYKSSNGTNIQAKLIFKSLKKEFRRVQRRNQYECRNKQFIKLNTLLKNERKKFWKCVRNKREKRAEIDIDIQTLTREYEKQFSEYESKDDVDNNDEIHYIVNSYQEFLNNQRINYTIEASEISSIIKNLPNNKSKGPSGISNEMIKYSGSSYFIEILANLFETCFKTGILPSQFNVGKIIPVIKNPRGPTDQLQNLRPITISDTMSIIFEKFLLKKINAQIIDHKSQFGFVANSSTQHAIFVFKEAANYYLQNNSRVYACAIDSSKAFDKVWREGLFVKMIDKIDKAEWRILKSYYDKSSCYIELNGIVSKEFKTKVGVKQGGPLSPKLYNVYIKDVIERIEDLKRGIQIGDFKTSIILYADDIMLLSSTRTGMTEMINATNDYMKEWKIKMNISKTNYIAIGKEVVTPRVIKVNNEVVNKVQTLKYLGVTIDENLLLTEHIKERSKINLRASYSLYNIGFMSKSMNTYTKSFIYKTYCRPALLYGMEFVEISDKNIKQMRTDESLLIKRVLSVHKTSKSTILYQTLNLRELDLELYIMKLKLFLRLTNNELTSSLIKSLMGDNNENHVNKSFLNEIKEIKHILGVTSINKKAIKMLVCKVKEIEKSDRNLGEIDSVIYCLNFRFKNEKLNKTLFHLIKYKQVIKCNLIKCK